MRKRLPPFITLLLCLLVGVTAHAASSADSDFKITLLGTGTPIPDPERFGPSTLVEAGNQKLLFDAGRGGPIRLEQIHVPMSKTAKTHRLDQCFPLRSREALSSPFPEGDARTGIREGL